MCVGVRNFGVYVKVRWGWEKLAFEAPQGPLEARLQLLWEASLSHRNDG